MLLGAGHGRVQPSVEGHAEGVGGYVAEVDKHVVPLAALGLVARHGIGVFYLQGVPVGVGAQRGVACLLYTSPSPRDM